MDLKQLRYFYDSAQSENFSKTAEKYMVPPSSVSAAVKRLENEIGVNLFERTSNRIELNTSGRILADALGVAFEQVENALQTITDSGELKKEIRLLVRVRRKWITDLIIEYQQKHPNVTFGVTNDFSTEDFEGFDIIIDEQLDRYSERERFLLSVEQICIKASKDSPLAGRTLTMRELHDQSFIMMGSASPLRRLLERTGRRCGFAPRVAIECDDRQCMVRCVEAGMGLMLGTRKALQDKTESNIVPLNVTDFNEVQTAYVYHRRLESGDNALRDFLNFLAQKAEEVR